MSAQYDDNNTFILFVNDKGDNPKRPDRTGNITIDGTKYRLSGWVVTDESGQPKLDKNGKPMLKGKVQPADEQPQRQSPAAAPTPSLSSDEIPF